MNRPSYYVYLIASLPMLHFGARPPLSFEKFLSAASGLISDEELDILRSVTISGRSPSETGQPTLKRWYEYDTNLRNELVKIRALRKRLDPSKYVRASAYADSRAAHLAVAAYRNPHIQEAENFLDRERWRALDEMSFGHYFDLDFLIIYAIKLKLLIKWQEIGTSDRSKLLEETIGKS